MASQHRAALALLFFHTVLVAPVAEALGQQEAEAASEGAAEESTPQEPERVLLVNGDRLTGRILGLSGGVLVLESSYAPRLEVAFDQVATLATERIVTLELIDEETASGVLSGGPTGEVWVEPEGDLPGFSIPLSRILAIEPPPPAPPVRYLAGLGLAASFQRGNTWLTALSADARGERLGPRDRTELRLRWQDAQEDRERVSNSTFGAAKYERTLLNGIYAFAGAEGLSDSQRDLRLRAVVSLGAGYQVVERQDAAFAVEVGASYLQRNFIDAPDQDELTVRLAARIRWLLYQRLELRDQLAVYPSFEEGGAQVRNELEVSSELFGRWAVKASWVLDYDSQAPAGLEDLDHLVLLGLQYTYR